MDTLVLNLPAELASVERARLAVLAHLEATAMSARARFGLELVLEEVIMNLALHAYRGAPEPGRFDLSVKRDAGGVLHLVFEDDGVDFDPPHAPPKPVPRSLDDAQPGGLGLLLVRQRALRLDHSRSGGRNRLEVDLAGN